ncbi:MAG: hypothetical protein KBD47_00400 [Candidatus Pacebacteria bacterium]|jgi:hypothetical protein|nr:hypothetical protein [Candidatus Paceibacterota bacterium]
MKNKLFYGASGLVSLLGLVALIGTSYSSYTDGYGIEFASILFIVLIVTLIACEIVKILKNYTGDLARNASQVNVYFFIVGLLFLAQKSHGFFNFFNVFWAVGSIAVGYTIALVINIIVMIRAVKNLKATN